MLFREFVASLKTDSPQLPDELNPEKIPQVQFDYLKRYFEAKDLMTRSEIVYAMLKYLSAQSDVVAEYTTELEALHLYKRLGQSFSVKTQKALADVTHGAELIRSFSSMVMEVTEDHRKNCMRNSI